MEVVKEKEHFQARVMGDCSAGEATGGDGKKCQCQRNGECFGKVLRREDL